MDEESDLAARLALDPAELKNLRHKCRVDREAVGAETCEAAARATRLRFMRGNVAGEAP